MKPRQLIYKTFFLFALAIAGICSSNAQAVKTYIDRNNILIGEHIRMDITVNLASPSYKVDFGIPDSIPHFDMINSDKRDTTDGGVYMLKQSLLFTSFDSGQWKFPAFPVTISSPDKGSQTFTSDSVIIRVGYSPADSTDQLRDIKPVMDVFVVDRTWLYYIGGALLAIILAFILYRYFKNRKKKAPPMFDAKLGPYDEAIKALNDLQQGGAADVKLYHSRISDIFKRYYSRKTNANLMSDTTSDLLIRLRQQATADTLSLAAEVLRLGDAVKFAKLRPADNENVQSINAMKLVIDQLEKK
ncbi:MAG: hypothetical protein QM687_05415 [Ferruginibacter sp.]